MAQLHAVLLFRQQLEERAEIVGIELLGRRELPQDRSELVAEFGHARTEEALDRFAGFRQHPPVGREAFAFSEKMNPSGASAAHLAKVAGLKVE